MRAALRVGLIGLGSIGRHHARILRDLPGVTLAAAADPLGDRHKAATGIPVVATLEELLSYKPDYCVVANPTTSHEPTALVLAAAGVHALIEKPLADNAAAADRIAAAFDRAQLVGAVGHVERYSPAFRELRARLGHGHLGEIYQVATRRQGPRPVRVHDIGVVKDLGIHDLDLTMWLTGQPLCWVAAQTVSRAGRAHEDMLAAIGALTSGAITSHLVNWLSAIRERTTVVTGEHGSLTADSLTGRTTYHATGSRILRQDDGCTTITRQEPLLAEQQVFRDAILGLSPDIVTLGEGAAAVAVADALLVAAVTGTGVTLRPRRHAQPDGSDAPI